MKRIKIEVLKCERCNHEWIPKKEEVRRCAKCKSPYWDIPKKQKGDVNEFERETDQATI